MGVATVTLQGAEGILVEGRHPLSVVFHGLEKPLKLRFVADNSICEALNQSWRRPSRRHRWSLWGHARSLWTLCIRYHPHMHWRVVPTRIGFSCSSCSTANWHRWRGRPAAVGFRDTARRPRARLSPVGRGGLLPELSLPLFRVGGA